MKVHEFKYITDVNNFLADNPDRKFKFKSQDTSSGPVFYLIEEDKGVEKFTKELKPE